MKSLLFRDYVCQVFRRYYIDVVLPLESYFKASEFFRKSNNWLSFSIYTFPPFISFANAGKSLLINVLDVDTSDTCLSIDDKTENNRCFSL